MVLGETQYAGFVNQKFAQMAQKKPKNPPSLKKLSEQEKAALKRIKKQRGTNPFNIGNDELATFDFDQITRLVTTALSSSECIEFYTTILSRASSKRNPVLQGGDLQKVFQSFMSQTTQPFTRKLPPFATRNASGYAFGLIGSKQGGGIYIVTSSSLDQAYVDAKVVIGELFHLAGSTDMYRDRELADLVHNSKFNVDESKLDPTDNVFSGQYVKGEYETEDTPYSIYFHRMAEMNCRLPQFAYP
jgi:hypothetical protein